ncbi:MAG: phage terminase family protein, partial [Defluviitaleaceae bacterium]|nr:phage terminase family protein [Defluviitaleaceae bacterium]
MAATKASESRAVKYAAWCLADGNKQVGTYIKKQARAWLEITDGKNPDAFFDETAYAKICGIIELMVHPDINGPLGNGLEDYAWFLITAALCTKLKSERGTDIRYYTTAVLEIARKNYKTFNAAVIFILLMLTDPKYSRFFSVAPDLKLSSELKLAIRKIIKSSPALADDDVFRIMRSEIRCLINESDYMPLAYSHDRMDGKVANAFVTDEAGAMD